MAWNNGRGPWSRTALLVSSFAALLLWQGLDDLDPGAGQGVARASSSWSVDTDSDGLPDEIELIFGTQPFLANTDGDQYNDGVEWALRSDPLDSSSQPKLAVAMRSYAYETSQGRVRVFTLFFPGSVSLIDDFEIYLASPRIGNAPLGDSSLGILDFTPYLQTLPNLFSYDRSRGLGVFGFTFELTVSLVKSYAPLSIGVAANMSGTAVIDQMTLTELNGTTMVFFPDPSSAPSGVQAQSSFWFLPLNPAGGGGGDPEYCETQLGGGDPTGAGGILYQVESSDCVPDGLLYCVDADCDSLVGQQLVLIDYGFLKNKADS